MSTNQSSKMSKRLIVISLTAILTISLLAAIIILIGCNSVSKANDEIKQKIETEVKKISNEYIKKAGDSGLFYVVYENDVSKMKIVVPNVEKEDFDKKLENGMKDKKMELKIIYEPLNNELENGLKIKYENVEKLELKTENGWFFGIGKIFKNESLEFINNFINAFKLKCKETSTTKNSFILINFNEELIKLITISEIENDKNIIKLSSQDFEFKKDKIEISVKDIILYILFLINDIPKENDEVDALNVKGETKVVEKKINENSMEPQKDKISADIKSNENGTVLEQKTIEKPIIVQKEIITEIPVKVQEDKSIEKPVIIQEDKSIKEPEIIQEEVSIANPVTVQKELKINPEPTILKVEETQKKIKNQLAPQELQNLTMQRIEDLNNMMNFIKMQNELYTLNNHLSNESNQNVADLNGKKFVLENNDFLIEVKNIFINGNSELNNPVQILIKQKNMIQAGTKTNEPESQEKTSPAISISNTEKNDQEESKDSAQKKIECDSSQTFSDLQEKISPVIINDNSKQNQDDIRDEKIKNISEITKKFIEGLGTDDLKDFGDMMTSMSYEALSQQEIEKIKDEHAKIFMVTVPKEKTSEEKFYECLTQEQLKPENILDKEIDNDKKIEIPTGNKDKIPTQNLKTDETVVIIEQEKPKENGEKPKEKEEKIIVVEEEPEENEKKTIAVEEKPKIVEAEEKLSIFEEKPKENEEKIIVVEEKPKEGEEKPKIVEKQTKEGEEKPKIVEKQTKEGEEKPKIVEEISKENEEKIIVVEEKPKEGEEKPKIVEAEEKPKIVEEGEKPKTLIEERIQESVKDASLKEIVKKAKPDTKS